ncbi:MAG TPA: hypothetical protein VF399_03535 [bacterium]
MKVAGTSKVLGLILVVIGMTWAQGYSVSRPEFHGGSPPAKIVTSLGAQLSIPFMPKTGEVFEVTLTVQCNNDFENIHFGPDYTVKFFGSEGVEIISGKEHKFFGCMHKGDVKEFKAKMIIKKSDPRINIYGGISDQIWGPQGIGFDLFLIDNKTAQYGTKIEQESKLPVEYRYDPIVGSFTCTPSQNPAPVEENRRIINTMKQLEPALSDSEALLLHSEMYKVGIPKGAAIWDSLNQHWIDKGIFEYYLKDGWYNALQQGTLEQWREDEKRKIENEGKGGSINFFRGDSDNRGRFDDPPADSVAKTFDGKWRFKDQKYDKTNGLLADADKKAINGARARVLACYTCHGAHSILSRQCTTDTTGYFSVTMNIADACTLGKAYAIVYPCGGGTDTAYPMIKVSDPTPTSWHYNKDPLDTTLYVIKNMYYEEFYSTSTPIHFDSVYADTYPEVAQPQSGCINIYETYLHARTFMDPAPTRSLRCLWEPGYSAWTGMDSLVLDTVWINGNNNIEGGSDEWDDDVLLHEFGHYVMDFYTQKPDSSIGEHVWPWSYSDKPGIGYSEGWAHLFSCRARVGSNTDTLIINTAQGIGGDSVYMWNNIESPLIASDFQPDTFIGGPWCEGAVAGALWDVYDSHNEIPYDSYPDSLYGIWFPDTALADSLSMGFDEIWNVFDNYDPVGLADTNCQTVFHFRSGWNYYNYDHAFALNQIYLHHRIRDSIPAKPTGLSAAREGYAVRLYWHKNAETDLKGYRLHRRSKYTIGFPPPPWSTWAMIAEKSAPNDTTHLDQTVQNLYRYQYKVAAYDSLGNESPFSDSVEILDNWGNNPDGMETFCFVPTVVTEKNDMVITISKDFNNCVLSVYDCYGRLINKRQLKTAQSGNVKYNLVDTQGRTLSGGVYFLSITSSDMAKSVVKKFVILR